MKHNLTVKNLLNTLQFSNNKIVVAKSDSIIAPLIRKFEIKDNTLFLYAKETGEADENNIRLTTSSLLAFIEEEVNMENFKPVSKANSILNYGVSVIFDKDNGNGRTIGDATLYTIAGNFEIKCNISVTLSTAQTEEIYRYLDYNGGVFDDDVMKAIKADLLTGETSADLFSKIYTAGCNAVKEGIISLDVLLGKETLVKKAVAKFNVGCYAVYASELEIPLAIADNKEATLDYIQKNLDNVAVKDLTWISDMPPFEAVTMDDLRSVEVC